MSKLPNFKNRHIELRFEDEEVCIYATKEGLKQIIDFCEKLISKPQIGHIHLEDYEVLTDESSIGVIAVF